MRKCRRRRSGGTRWHPHRLPFVAGRGFDVARDAELQAIGVDHCRAGAGSDEHGEHVAEPGRRHEQSSAVRRIRHLEPRGLARTVTGLDPEPGSDEAQGHPRLQMIAMRRLQPERLDARLRYGALDAVVPLDRSLRLDQPLCVRGEEVSVGDAALALEREIHPVEAVGIGCNAAADGAAPCGS